MILFPGVERSHPVMHGLGVLVYSLLGDSDHLQNVKIWFMVGKQLIMALSKMDFVVSLSVRLRKQAAFIELSPALGMSEWAFAVYPSVCKQPVCACVQHMPLPFLEPEENGSAERVWVLILI